MSVPVRPAPNRRAGVRVTASPSITAHVPSSLQARMKNRTPPIIARLRIISRIQKDLGKASVSGACDGSRTPKNSATQITVPTTMAHTIWVRSGTLAYPHARR